MIYDNEEGTNKAILSFDVCSQEILREITSNIGFFKNKYMSLKQNIYLINVILIGLENPKWKTNPEYLLPIIESLNNSISMTIVSLLQRKVRKSDLTIDSTLELIDRNRKLFYSFVIKKYNYNLEYSVFISKLSAISSKWTTLMEQEKIYVKDYRDKKIAHYTTKSFSDEFMTNVFKEQKRIYLELTELFKLVITLMVKTSIVAEPIVSTSNAEIIKISNILLKKLGVFKYSKGKLTSDILEELGFQRNKHFTIFYNDGTKISS